MGRSCFVLECHSGNCKDNIVLFKAPKDEGMLKIWRKSIGRTDRILTRNHHVCERHFEEHYIVRRRIETFGGIVLYDIAVRAQLTEGAVPTIFPNRLQYLSKSRKTVRKKFSLGLATNQSLTETNPDRRKEDDNDSTFIPSDNDKSTLCSKYKTQSLRFQRKERLLPSEQLKAPYIIQIRKDLLPET